MHPGPMNRGIEIASDVADGTRSLILDQVANGLAVRMAVLYLLAGGSLLAQHGDERAKSAQPPAGEGASPEHALHGPPHTIEFRDSTTRPARPATDEGAKSAPEFETVDAGNPETRNRPHRPGRPKLAALTNNSQTTTDS
jgi:hypothetical protein